MKRMFAVAGVATAMVLASCGQPAEDRAAPAEAVAADTAAYAPPAAVDAATPAAALAAPTAVPAAPGAPGFAVIYPGGAPKAPAVAAQSPAGPGGMIEFTTDATPEQVVAFYRRRAEAEGLKTINSLNSDGVRGYGAGDGADGSGKLLNVIATPLEGGGTDVHLDWSNGR